MKVLMVHNYYRQRGGESICFNAEKELLQAHGHTVVTYVQDNLEIDSYPLHRKALLPIQTIWSSTSKRELDTLIQFQKPDIAHFHNTFMLISPSAYAFCRNYGVPVVQTLHNFRLLCPSAIFFRDGHICKDCLGKIIPWPSILHRCYRRSFLQTATVGAMITIHRWLQTWRDKVDAYIALSRFAKDMFIAGGLPKQKIFVKPNFISLSPVTIRRKGNYFLYVGRLTKEKGVLTLLKAWETLEATPLKIVGSGPEFENVKHLVSSFHRANVEVLGHCSHDKVLSLMKDALCLVFPSEWYEGFPMTIVEAFSSGIPVLASNIGTMAEIIQDQINGLLFEPGNSHDLRSKVNWALSHREAIVEMGLTARRICEEKYTADKNHNSLINIYKAVIKEKRD